MSAILSHIIAIAAGLTPVDLLMCSTGALAAAIVALYRDCKADRMKLWAEIRAIKSPKKD